MKTIILTLSILSFLSGCGSDQPASTCPTVRLDFSNGGAYPTQEVVPCPGEPIAQVEPSPTPTVPAPDPTDLCLITFYECMKASTTSDGNKACVTERKVCDGNPATN